MEERLREGELLRKGILVECDECLIIKLHSGTSGVCGMLGMTILP